ncbi:translocation and assembly module lipoprotein TamL [Chryseolinea lacunae]|uniref:BamA/TamA family outer membrane protein n=1 Tax=Chryseolinea lacunae TaxID=2801331 RepID=A0ABS1KYZ7_9BACT|nr:BamA/TamA family outer membrane protein [Chryseolinea lacunae]MBL0743556.1 BamA/TamA family outer membrane protein [Chryseolinea lacunae]
MRTSNCKYILFTLWLAVSLSGCLGVKHLKENEKLLFRQTVQAPKNISEEDLRNLYIQRPNRKILGLPVTPLVSIYYFGERRYDQEKYIRRKAAVEKKYDDKIAGTSSERKINNYQFKKLKKIDKLNGFIENGNIWMQWGEPVSVYDSAKAALTQERYKDYLFGKGYFKNKVTHKISNRGKLVTVTYKVEPGQAYFIDSIFHDVADTALLHIVNDNVRTSFIVKNSRYDQDNFAKERERLDLLIKDYGYYDFSRQYIDFDIDTTFRTPERKVAVIISIKDPARRGYHKKFTIDEVNFTTDVGTNVPNRERTTRSYRDIHYQYYKNNYNLKILSQRVFLQPGEVYSRTKTLRTQQQLGNVEAFKFININYDTTGGKFVANIFASPLSRYEWTNEAGVSVTQGFPGPFYNISFKKRNVFKGMETFDLNGRFGFEGVASATSSMNVYKSTEAGVNAAMTFPQFIWPFKERLRYKFAQYNPKTKFVAGYTYTDRPEYRRTVISFNGTYTWQSANRKRTYSLTPLNLGVIDTSKLSPTFRELLRNQAALGNNSLINSFRPSFVNSIIFGITWNLNNYGNKERDSWYIRTQLESGGTIWNVISPKFISDFELEYFKYLRFSLDVRKTDPLNKNTILAYRLNSGFAYSYSDNHSLPYEKFFFAGGSNSIRAWRPRRLGPGSAKPPESPNPVADGLYDYSIEKPSEILLEASIELRQKLFGFVNGAVFIDAGNVWSFRALNVVNGDGQIVQDKSSQFSIDRFYKEIGVGTGFGLRFDFTFLILRFDVGMKVYDPARPEGDRFVLDKVRFWKPYAKENGDGTYFGYREPVIYNVGIGFPF